MPAEFSGKGMDELQDLFEKLLSLIKDTGGITGNIAEILLAGVQENFLQSGRENNSSGTWKPLSPVTLERRGRYRNSPILRVKNLLYQSLQQSHDDKSAVVGTNMKYAATMHFGAKKGEFGSYRGPSGTWKPRPIPWGDIPARPYMTATDQEIEDIIDFLKEEIKNITEAKNG